MGQQRDQLRVEDHVWAMNVITLMRLKELEEENGRQPA